MVRPDTGGEYQATFVVRDDERDSDILMQQSNFTYHAYNNYGSKSLYTYNSGTCTTLSQNPRGVAVSLFRPLSGDMSNDGEYSDIYVRNEYPMLRWLEQQGYDVTYATNSDTHRWGQDDSHNALLDHNIFLSVGHDEYWTQAIDDAVTEARNAGVSIGFFSANTSYWRVRMDDDPNTGDTASTIISYKTTEAGVGDPSGIETGTFRDPEGVNDPENGLIGVAYIGDNDKQSFAMRVTADYAGDRLYRHTDIQAMPDDMYINIGKNIIGWEWDAVLDNGASPENLEILAESPVYGLEVAPDGNFYESGMSTNVVHVTRYEHPSGAIVFASGTNQWAWGLGMNGVIPVEVDLYIPQITYNVLADMGVQPTTPHEQIVLDGDDGMITSDWFVPVDSPAPEIINLEVDTSGGLLTSGRSVTFRWETDMPSTSQVYIGTEPERIIDMRTTDTYLKTEHDINITGHLDSNRTYYFRVASVNEFGQITLSDVGSFHTPFNLIVVGGFGARDLLESGQCLAQANPPLAIGIVVVMGVIGLGILYGFWRLIRRWRNRGSQTTS